MSHPQKRLYTRREFFRQGLGAVALAGAAASFPQAAQRGDAFTNRRTFGVVRSRSAPNDRVQVACIGLGDRGRQHLSGLEAVPEAAVVALCDVDQVVLYRRADLVRQWTGQNVSCYVDYRRLLEDRRIDAVSVATCNHTHALIALAALEAGKDVYIEKPCSHNLFEGRQLERAAQAYGRICFHGTQSRSSPAVQEAVQQLQAGLIGRVRLARVRCSVGPAPPAPTPDEPTPSAVAYDLWLGPAPARPFNRNRFHRHWRWWWEYGNGPLGNQALHLVDLARWGLGVGWPRRVQPLPNGDRPTEHIWETTSPRPTFPGATGDQCWVFDFPGDKRLVLELRANEEAVGQLGRRQPTPETAIFYGSEGVMEVDYFGYRTFFGRRGAPGPHGQAPSEEFEQFIHAVRTRRIEPGGPDIHEGHLSSGLVHLANIAARLRRPVEFDPHAETILADEEAGRLCTRLYRRPFVVREIGLINASPLLG